MYIPRPQLSPRRHYRATSLYCTVAPPPPIMASATAAAAARPRRGLFCILPGPSFLFFFRRARKEGAEQERQERQQRRQSVMLRSTAPPQLLLFLRSALRISSFVCRRVIAWMYYQLKRNSSDRPASGSACLACSLFPPSSRVRYRVLLGADKQMTGREGVGCFRPIRYFFLSPSSFLRALSLSMILRWYGSSGKRALTRT